MPKWKPITAWVFNCCQSLPLLQLLWLPVCECMTAFSTGSDLGGRAEAEMVGDEHCNSSNIQAKSSFFSVFCLKPDVLGNSKLQVFICVCPLTSFLLGKTFLFWLFFALAGFSSFFRVYYHNSWTFGTILCIDFQILFPVSCLLFSVYVQLSTAILLLYSPLPESFLRRERKPRHVVTFRNSEKNSNWRKTSRYVTALHVCVCMYLCNWGLF